MSDSLNAAFDSYEQTDTAPATEAPVADTTPAPAAEPAEAAAPQESARTRGPDGKFLKRDGSPSPAPDAAPSPATHAVPPTLQLSGGGRARRYAPRRRPHGPRRKGKWTALDPTVKGEIARREREIEVGMSKASEVRRFGDSVMQEFAPYAQLLSKEGATPQGAIRALLETVHTLRYGSPEHKHALFMSMAEQYGIDVTK
jgi:hypothetical protein